MSDPTTESIGKILFGGEIRDAVHFAVTPVVLMEKMAPGQRVKLVPGSNEQVCRWTGSDDNDGYIGIIDPFLPPNSANKGTRCWMFLRPCTITSLRHEWTHPAFGEHAAELYTDSLQEESVKWLKKFAEDNGVGYARMVSTMDAGGAVHMDHDVNRYADDEFWRHMGIVTGKLYDDNHQNNAYFSCSC